MNKEAKERGQIELSIQDGSRPWPGSSNRNMLTGQELATMLVATAKKVIRLKGQTDAFKIQDGDMSRVLCLRNKGSESALQLYAPWSPETAYTISLDRLRIFSPFDVGTVPTSPPRVVAGRRSPSVN